MANNQKTQAQQLEDLKRVQALKNAQFMRYTYIQTIKANNQNSTEYKQGGTNNFTVPIVSGGYLQAIEIRQDLSVDITGENAKLTAAGEYATFNNVSIRYGNEVVRMHPYVSKVLRTLQGHQKGLPHEVQGFKADGIQALLHSEPKAAAGVNRWKTSSFIELNALHDTSVNGLLPMDATGTQIQISLTAPASFVGNDPLDNALTGEGVTADVTGNVEVICYYRTYQSMSMLQPLTPDLTGQPMAQIIKPQEINPLTGGVMNFGRITNPYPFAKWFSIVIDGKQADKFASAGNIKAWEIDQAENTSSAFFRFDETTGGMESFYSMTRDSLGQDLDEGILHFDATIQNQADASNRTGDAYLNLTNSGYPAARIGVKVDSVDASKTTPRVVNFGVILNPAGINIA